MDQKRHINSITELIQHSSSLYCLNINSQKMVHIGSGTGELISVTDDLISIVSLHVGIIRSILVKGDLIFTCSEDSKIKVYNPNNKKLTTIGKHENFVNDFTFFGNSLYSCGYEGEIKKWELNT